MRRRLFCLVLAGCLLSVPEVGAAAQYVTLHSFHAARDDAYVSWGTLGVVGTTLFGTSFYGGVGSGQLYSMNTDNGEFGIVHTFQGGYDGDGSFTGVTVVGSTIYGTTVSTVFRVNADGTGYQSLGPLMAGNDVNRVTVLESTIYGTKLRSTSDTPDQTGTLFAMNTDGSNYRALHAFQGGSSDGAWPFAGLSVVGSTLFGTTIQGGADDAGTIFAIDADGNNFRLLHSFAPGEVLDGVPGATALTAVGSILYGTTLYSTTRNGGTDNAGTVFRINADGSGFQTVHTFYGADGGGPGFGLTLIGSQLYGTTRQGGEGSAGTIYRMNLDGSDFEVLHSFFRSGSAPATPYSGVTLVGTSLYGTTLDGGEFGTGTIYAVSLVPEPSSMVLLVLGSTGLLLETPRRRCARHRR